VKEVELMGCTLMGVTLIGMMASFPRVQERVKHWSQELANGNLVVEALRSIPGTKVRSEYPRNHTLTRVDTIGSFDKVAQTHKKRGFFFSNALKDRGITGIIPGATKVWKFNTYGLSQKQARYLASSFMEIAVENGIPVDR
jgi:Sep-tRNA:Cys-tRNA synthetase